MTYAGVWQRLVERQQDATEKEHNTEQQLTAKSRKISSTGRAVSREELGYSSDVSLHLYKRPGNLITTAPLRASKRIPKKKTEVAPRFLSRIRVCVCVCVCVHVSFARNTHTNTHTHMCT